MITVLPSLFIWAGFIIALVILVPVLWILAILKLIREDKLDSTQRILWILIILCFPIIGPSIFFMFGDKF